jgi:acetylornithine/succinyldiaminopimelate/putrescine aminotransferase
MSAVSALVKSDQDHIIHPLHYAKDNESPLVVVEGRGEMLIDADGKQYIDGLSGLWNVNAGHGRKELAEVAAAQMSKLAFASAYSGQTNFPAVRLAEKLVKLAYPNTSAVQDRAFLLEGAGQAGQGKNLLARPRLSRRDHGRHERHGHGLLSQDVRTVGTELHAGTRALSLPLARQWRSRHRGGRRG